MSRRAWLTPDTVAGSTRCYRLSIPDDEASMAFVVGALLLLTDPENWEEFGDKTPDEMADIFDAVLQDLSKRRSCVETGTLFYWAGEIAPTHGLPCDGSEVLVADYPELYAVIGDSWGTPSDGDHFVLPLLEDVFLLASGTSYPAGATGGGNCARVVSGRDACTHP
jgi:hypothetical protein